MVEGLTGQVGPEAVGGRSRQDAGSDQAHLKSPLTKREPEQRTATESRRPPFTPLGLKSINSFRCKTNKVKMLLFSPF